MLWPGDPVALPNLYIYMLNVSDRPPLAPSLYRVVPNYFFCFHLSAVQIMGVV